MAEKAWPPGAGPRSAIHGAPRSIRRSGTGETLKECGDAGRRGLLCKRGKRRAGCSAYRTLSHQHARSGDIAAHSSHACEYEPYSTDCT